MLTFALLAIIYGLLVAIGYVVPYAYDNLRDIPNPVVRAALFATAVLFTLPVMLLFTSTPDDRSLVWAAVKRAARRLLCRLRYGKRRLTAVHGLYEADWW